MGVKVINKNFGFLFKTVDLLPEVRTPFHTCVLTCVTEEGS
jgi:hypothetical protein